MKLNSGHIDKFEKLAVVAHVLRQIWSFHIVLLQRTAKKCTTNYNAHAQLLFCSSLIKPFVVFLRPWQTRAHCCGHSKFHAMWNAGMPLSNSMDLVIRKLFFIFMTDLLTWLNLKRFHVPTRITSWILPGPLLPKKPKAYSSMRKVVYINKFVAGYENRFYLKCSSKKKRLNTNVKRENDICLCTHFR